MLATVTNMARSARGFATIDHGIVVLESGASALLDLAEHALHRAWEAAEEVVIAPLSDKDARAARKRREGETAAHAAVQAEALASLPPAAPSEG